MMFLASILVVAAVAACLIWPFYVESRKEYRKLVDAPRLTVRALSYLRELPEWAVLEARTGAGTATAPLSATRCAWYRVTAGRTHLVGDAASEVMSAVIYSETSQDNGIPLVDVVDSDAVVWLSGDLAARSLGSTFPTLTTSTVDERAGFPEPAGGGWPYLRQLQADGHLSTGDLLPAKHAHGLAVAEQIAPADTPVLILGRPQRRDNGIVLLSAGGWKNRLEGVTTWPDSRVRRQFAVRVTVYRRLIAGCLIVIVLACGAIAILGAG